MVLPHIRLHKAVNLSIAHAMTVNEPNIHWWFTEYSQVLIDLNIQSPDYIWSGDETGVQIVPKEKYLGEVNEPLYYQVPADQGETSTILSFVNVTGRVCPPMIIHKGQRIQRNWSDGMPSSMKLATTSKGYITKCKLHEYGIRFVKYLNDISQLDQNHL